MRSNRLPIHLPLIDDKDKAMVAEALESTFVSGDGPMCRQFEEEFQRYIGVKYAFFTTSCTAALDLAFMIKDFPDGSEVIVPNFTYTSTALAPILNNLKVVLVDVYADNGNIDVSKIEEKISGKTVAVMPVDYAGNPAEMDEINAIAKKHNLYVVHDTAQSIGSLYKGRKTGSIADVSTFSFHGTKNITTGEGGMICTNDDKLAEKIKICREKGTDKWAYLSDPEKQGFYEYVSIGNSYVQSNILAALGISQLRKVEDINNKRKEIAEKYTAAFSDYSHISLPRITDGAEGNRHLFYILVPPDKKEEIIKAFKAEGISSNVHYTPLHLNQYYRNLAPETEFPQSVEFFKRLIRIPIYPTLTDKDIDDVIAAGKKIFDNLL